MRLPSVKPYTNLSSQLSAIAMSRILVIGGCGYIGSALYRHLQAKGYDVVSVDLEIRGNPLGRANWYLDYRNITADQFAKFDTIIWLAGHSSVPQSVSDPVGAFSNNLTGLVELATKLSGQKLIYASSSSVYDGQFEAAETVKPRQARNVYDYTKWAADEAMRLLYKNYYALRFGTVCGASPNTRDDLMINAMVKNAIERGKVEIRNQTVRRPILGIRDLCRAVERLAVIPVQPGVYNLASFNSAVEPIAEIVSSLCRVPYLTGKDTECYNFSVSCDKIKSALSFKPSETIETITMSLLQHYMARKAA